MREHESLAAELKELKALRTSIDARINRIQKLLNLGLTDRSDNIDGSIVAKYIREWLDENHTVEMLAEKADISPATVYNVLDGRRVRETTVDKILTALGLVHIFNEIVPPTPPQSKYYEE